MKRLDETSRSIGQEVGDEASRPIGQGRLTSILQWSFKHFKEECLNLPNLA